MREIKTILKRYGILYGIFIVAGFTVTRLWPGTFSFGWRTLVGVVAGALVGGLLLVGIEKWQQFKKNDQ